MRAWNVGACIACSAFLFVGASRAQDDPGARWRVSENEGSFHLDWVAEGSDAYGAFRFSCIASSGLVKGDVVLDEKLISPIFSALSKASYPYNLEFNGDKNPRYINSLHYDEMYGWKLQFDVAAESPALALIGTSGKVEVRLDDIHQDDVYSEGKEHVSEFIAKCKSHAEKK